MRVLDAVQHIVVRRWSGIVTTPGSAAHRPGKVAKAWEVRRSPAADIRTTEQE